MNLLQSSGKFILAHVFILAQESCSTATTFFFFCCIEAVMMRRLVTCVWIALLGFCLHLKGCGSGGTSGTKKCACNRRLETARGGRMLSSRRRRFSTDSTEYSEVCCDDWDPGSSVTDAPNTDSLDWLDESREEEFNNVLDQISRRRYVSTTIEATAASNTSEGTTATTTVG